MLEFCRQTLAEPAQTEFWSADIHLPSRLLIVDVGPEGGASDATDAANWWPLQLITSAPLHLPPQTRCTRVHTSFAPQSLIRDVSPLDHRVLEIAAIAGRDGNADSDADLGGDWDWIGALTVRVVD